MTSFQERFKGKTSVMPKEGIISVIQGAAQPILKNHNTKEFQHYGQYTMEQNQESLIDQYHQKPFQTNNHHISQEQSPKYKDPYFHQNNYQPYQDITLVQQKPSLKYATQPEKMTNPSYSNNPYSSQQPTSYSYQQPYHQQPYSQLPPSHYPPPQHHTYERQAPKTYGAPGFQEKIVNRQAVMTDNQAFMNVRDHDKQRRSQPQHSVDSYVRENQFMDVTNHSKKVPATSTGGYIFIRSSSKYRPYTLREYEEMKKVAAPKLGGLGPNINSEDWRKEKEKVQKRQEFADQVKQYNTANLIPQQEPKYKKMPTPNPRQRAIDFARNIPRPNPLPRRQQNGSMNGISVPENKESEIERLEQQHLQYLQQIDNLK